MHTTRYFRMEELVPPDIHARWRQTPHKLFMLFDVTALRTLDALRHRYGPLVVNNWHQGGPFRHSGWRPWDCAEGAALSQHKLGRAFDCKFTRISAEEVRQDLAMRPHDDCFAGIRRIEAFEGMSWFHFDTGNHDRENEGILVVSDVKSASHCIRPARATALPTLPPSLPQSSTPIIGSISGATGENSL